MLICNREGGEGQAPGQIHPHKVFSRNEREPRHREREVAGGTNSNKAPSRFFSWSFLQNRERMGQEITNDATTGRRRPSKAQVLPSRKIGIVFFLHNIHLYPWFWYLGTVAMRQHTHINI